MRCMRAVRHAPGRRGVGACSVRGHRSRGSAVYHEPDDVVRRQRFDEFDIPVADCGEQRSGGPRIAAPAVAGPGIVHAILTHVAEQIRAIPGTRSTANAVEARIVTPMTPPRESGCEHVASGIKPRSMRGAVGWSAEACTIAGVTR